MDHLLSKEKVSDTQIKDLDCWLVDEGHLRILFNFEGLKDSKRIWGCSSAGRAPALQAGGREFEPHHLHQSARSSGRRGMSANVGL